MSQPPSVASQEQVIDTMIELTRLSTQHRAILAGSDSLELYLALRRRGFNRVATTATCRIPKGQHAVGLITGQNSLQAIEAALTKISQFLSASAAVAVLIDSPEGGSCLKIRSKLEQGLPVCFAGSRPARIVLALAPPSIAVVSFVLRCPTPIPHVQTGRPGSSLHRSRSKQAFNAPRQQTASVEIPIASDARPRHTSRGFLPWRFAYAGPGVSRATFMGPPSANLHKTGSRVYIRQTLPDSARNVAPGENRRGYAATTRLRPASFARYSAASTRPRMFSAESA